MSRVGEQPTSIYYRPVKTGLKQVREELTKEKAKARAKRDMELEPFAHSSGQCETDFLVKQILEEDCAAPSSMSTEWEARTGMTRNERRRWRKLEKKAAKLVSAVGSGI